MDYTTGYIKRWQFDSRTAVLQIISMSLLGYLTLLRIRKPDCLSNALGSDEFLLEADKSHSFYRD
jgi:hypothetical protein